MNSPAFPPADHNHAGFLGELRVAQTVELVMSLLSQISFDEVVGSFLVCLILREIMILALPDRIAGPGGWLIDTGHEDF
jgi:hypothetical protein